MTELATFVVIVPRTLPNLNSRDSIWARNRQVAAVKKSVIPQAAQIRLQQYEWPVCTAEPRTLHIVHLLGKGMRAHDIDNLYGCLKSVVDSLVIAGWLADDRPAMLPQYTVDQRRDPCGPACEITISTLEEAV